MYEKILNPRERKKTYTGPDSSTLERPRKVRAQAAMIVTVQLNEKHAKIKLLLPDLEHVTCTCIRVALATKLLRCLPIK